jgi:tripartite-type tricarboxylate transporter receptor subunit TctC
MRSPALTRRHLLQATAAACLAPAALTSRAQPGGSDFPSRPISLWVPWAAGGGTDLTMRLLGELAGRQLGQRVIVENRGGAGGTLAMPVLQQAAPDGYTIGQVPQPVFRAAHTQKVLWDPLRDLTPILQLSGVTFGLVVPASSPFKSLDDVFEYARSHPGALTVATNGVGTTPHMVMDELLGRRNQSYIHVPYKGTSEQMLAVASGQVMVGVNSNGFAPFVDSGTLRLLVTFGERRTKRWPHVPTLKELGHGIVASSPYGLCGPKGMPRPVVMALHDAFRTAAHDPLHVAELAKYDQELNYLGPEDYGRSMREQWEAEKRLVERLGLGRSGS